MGTLNIHPIGIERKKIVGKEMILDQTELNKKYDIYIQLQKQFDSQCNKLLVKFNNQKELKKVRKYLAKKDFKKRLPIEIDLLHLEKEVEKLLSIRKKLIDLDDSFNNELEQSELLNRQELKLFLKENKNMMNMLFITNRDLYFKTERYIAGEFDDSSRKLRKVEIPVLKIVYKALTKTSPYFFFNDVIFYSNKADNFSYRIKDNLITPNYVFFYRLLYTLLLKEQYLFKAKFRLSPRISIIGEQKDIYIFDYEHNNFKIFNSMPKMKKLAMNPLVQTILQSSEKEYTLASFSKKFSYSSLEGSSIIKKLVDLGIFEIQLEMIESMDVFNMLENKINDLKINDEDFFMEELSGLLKNMKTNFLELNTKFSSVTYHATLELYKKIAAYVEMDCPEEGIMIYGDNVVQGNELADKEKNDRELPEHLGNMLKIFAVFDINERTKNEFIHRLGKVTTSDNLLNTRNLELLMEQNLYFGEFWTKPWKEFEFSAPNNLYLEKLKQKYVAFIRESLHEEVELDVTSVFDEIVSDLEEKKYEAEDCYYSIFYQKDESKTIINNIYSGFGSFYQRYLRYTDILEKNKNSIEDFYYHENFEWIELHEHLGFNANMVDSRYFKKRYQDETSRERTEEPVIKEKDSELILEDQQFYLKKGHEKFKPVISSSLIRSFFPGKLVFLTSIFSNVNFLVESSFFWLENNQDPYVKIPRISYQNIVLERRKVYVETSYLLKYYSKKNTVKNYLSLRQAVKNLGFENKFFIQSRKSDSKDPIVSFVSSFDKPQYIDLNNPLLFRLFLNFLRSSNSILIQELLPKNESASEYLQEVRYGD